MIGAGGTQEISEGGSEPVDFDSEKQQVIDIVMGNQPKKSDQQDSKTSSVTPAARKYQISNPEEALLDTAAFNGLSVANKNKSPQQ